MKAEKCVREQIARMSSKPMYRVQEEVGSLKQLCVLVSSSLQRNGAAIEKLKRESAQVGAGWGEWWGGGGETFSGGVVIQTLDQKLGGSNPVFLSETLASLHTITTVTLIHAKIATVILCLIALV